MSDKTDFIVTVCFLIVFIGLVVLMVLPSLPKPVIPMETIIRA